MAAELEPIEPGGELAALSAAERMLAAASTVADAIEVLAYVEAAIAMAKRARAAVPVLNQASYIELLAGRRLAELVREGQARGEITTPGGNSRNSANAVPVDQIEDHRRLAEWGRVLDNFTAADLAAERDKANAEGEAMRRRYELAQPGPVQGKNSGVSEWYTPAELIAAAVEVLGAIDLDPASTAEANEQVGAERIYTAAEDGLDRGNPWAGRVWMNPPYSQPAVARFALRLAGEFTAGNVTAAITLTNNATETGWWQVLYAAASAECWPLGRLKFWRPDPRPDDPSAPLQGQSILYLGPYPGQFVEAFAPFGQARRWVE